MLVDVVKLAQEGQRDAAHDLFDAHLPLIRYEQQQGIGLAVRKYVLQKRGAIATTRSVLRALRSVRRHERRSIIFCGASRVMIRVLDCSEERIAVPVLVKLLL